jgi:uncharacterized membrane protein YsdA (DUF1294 family)
MPKVNQLQINQTQQQYSPPILEQPPQKTAEELKKQREDFRRKTFFTPIQLTANNANHNSNINNQFSEYRPFFDTLGTANFLKVKEIFIQEVNEFKTVTNYFAENKYTTNLKNFITRIDDEKEPESESKLLTHIRCCVFSLHNLTSVLNNLKYQIEQENKTATENIVSKDTIASYLNDVMVGLDACWGGISSRFTDKAITLSSLNEGIPGRINIIKKELLDAFLAEYLNTKKQEDSGLFIAGNEIHIRNALNNAMHEILGIHKIEDPLEDKGLNDSVKQEFIDLATIEISPARITSMLADHFYQDLTRVLDEASMSSWLIEYKSDVQIPLDIFNELNTKFFDKINILFKAGENKLNINSLLDLLEKEEEPTKYCLHQSREKIHQWIAKRLIPHAEKVFIKDISNGLTITSIDYMFFGVSETADNNNHSDSENYITLQLSHIQNIDFIKFTDVDPDNNCYLSDHKEKATTSITLVTQAMEQTNDAPTIVNFVTNMNNITKLNDLPLLKIKLKNILNSKLTNPSFNNEFSDTIIKLIKNNYKFNKDEIYYLLNNSTCNDFLIAMKKQGICIDNVLENINIKYLDNITIDILNETSADTKKSLFNKAVNANNCELIYNLLCASGSNKYTAYNDIMNNENLFALAVKYNHIKLVELLLQDQTLNIKDYNLYSSFYGGRCEIISLCIKHILANKARFTNDIFIKHLQANSLKGWPGLYVALQNGHEKTVKEYIKAILNIDIDGVTTEQKLKLIEAKSEDGYPGLYVALQNGHEKTGAEYIKAILNIDIDGVTAEQKLNLIEAKDKDGYPGLYLALQNGHKKTVAEYINAILNIDIDGVTAEQKLKLIEAKNKHGFPGLYLALENGHENTVAEYINAILNIDIDGVTTEQKLKLIEAKSLNGWPGLCVALANGHEKTVKEYIKDILNIDIDGVTAKQKLKLLEAKSENGFPGLYVALHNGHKKTVAEYFKVIVVSKKLTIEQKAMLVTKIRKKNVKLYTKLVTNSHLTVEEKNYLLKVNSSNCIIL